MSALLDQLSILNFLRLHIWVKGLLNSILAIMKICVYFQRLQLSNVSPIQLSGISSALLNKMMKTTSITNFQYFFH